MRGEKKRGAAAGRGRRGTDKEGGQEQEREAGKAIAGTGRLGRTFPPVTGGKRPKGATTRWLGVAFFVFLFFIFYFY